jgi:D-alanyl-D-alanine carboxypeptidase
MTHSVEHDASPTPPASLDRPYRVVPAAGADYPPTTDATKPKRGVAPPGRSRLARVARQRTTLDDALSAADVPAGVLQGQRFRPFYAWYRRAMVVSDGLRRPRRAFAVLVIACLAALGAPALAPAATTAPPALQEALDRLVSDGVPGAIALQREGGQEWHTASGVADLTTKRPISATDRFRIGSMTKAYVSTVVLQLVGERRLSLDDSVEHWLPGVVPGGDAITVRQLLNHTSGLYNYTDVPFYMQMLNDPLKTWRPLELVQRAVAQPPLFAPGTSWSYSNTNYILLGLIVAAVDKVPAPLQTASPALEVYRRIVAPLGLWRTSFPLTDPDIRGRHAHGYVIDPPPQWGLPAILDTTRFNPSWAWTAGAIVSTLDDVADFHRALFGGRLLAPDQQRDLETTVAAGAGVDYGLGVLKLQTPCGSAWGHDGAVPSAVSISLTSPDGARQAVLMLTRDINTWTEQIAIDYGSALLTAFCGEATPAAAAAARPLVAALARAQLVR